MAEGFLNRRDAGRKVAERLSALRRWDGAVVLALPRGGVPVAYEVAVALGVPLDVFLVRKLGVPGHQELAMGAIASGGVRVVNEDIISAAGISTEQLDEVTVHEAEELRRRESAYRGDRPLTPVAGRSVIVVDDGLATGASMRAAVAALYQQQPARLTIGVPVAASQSCTEFASLVDDVVCVFTPDPFAAVGHWYRDFSETSDEEVRILLAQAAARPSCRVA
jgi:predicted phosphoribosyltransferase